jgi:hypothetical protein
MPTRRNRRRFERAVARAMRPSSSAQWADKAWVWPVVVVGAALVPIAVWLVAWHVPLSGTSSPKLVADVPAAVPEPVTATAPETNNPRPDEVRRPDEARRAHLRQLQPVLRAEAEKIAEVARRIVADGRVTDLDKDRSEIATELRAMFTPNRALSEDLQNHYPDYARARDRLRRSVGEQEEEFHRTVLLVMTKLSPAPGAESRRREIAVAVLEKCLERGPGLVLKAGATDDDRAVFETFASFQPDANVTSRCASLSRRATAISAGARKLSSEAQGLAERTSLPGECKFRIADEMKRGMGETAHAPRSLPN